LIISFEQILPAILGAIMPTQLLNAYPYVRPSNNGAVGECWVAICSECSQVIYYRIEWTECQHKKPWTNKLAVGRITKTHFGQNSCQEQQKGRQ
jgi:hypothetical protein